MEIVTKTLDGKLIKANCALLNKHPYVCNNCKLKKRDCGLDKNLKLFFCNSNSSWEKGKIEKNHITLREILPKGSSFDDFTQSNVNIIILPINSLRRKYLHGKSSYEVFSFTFGEHIANLLGIFEIPTNEVILKPFLAKEIKDTNK